MPNHRKHAYNFYFILFVSSGLGMCDRLNSLICNDRLNSQWRLRHSGVIGKELNTALTLSFASLNAPYNPVRFMYGKRTASLQFLLCLSPRNTATTVRPRLSELLCFVKKYRFSEVSRKSESDL